MKNLISILILELSLLTTSLFGATVSVDANFTFEGNTTLLNNAVIGGYLSTGGTNLGNLSTILPTTSSTLSYDYNDTFTVLDLNETLTLNLSTPLDGNVSTITVLHAEDNATTDLNITKTISLSSLTIPVSDIGSVREIAFITSDGNFSGNIILDGNNSNVAATYQIPIINGNYAIVASYNNGYISYYHSDINDWGDASPQIINISTDTVLNDVPILMNINIPSVNLQEFNVTSIRAYTVDNTLESLFLYDYYGRGGSNTIVDASDNNFSAPVFYPDNNFSIEVNGTFVTGREQSSWFYNFNDSKLYPDINDTNNFKIDINATSNTFTIDSSYSNRQYYLFTGKVYSNDYNITDIVFMSDTIGLGYTSLVDENSTSYSVLFSELGNHNIQLLDNNSTFWYYNITTGDINSTPNSTYIDTSSSAFNFDLNLSSSNFEVTQVSSSNPPSITNIYDHFRRAGFSQFTISFDINDTDSSTLTLGVASSSSSVITTTQSVANGSTSANQTVTLTISSVSSKVIGDTEISISLSDGTTTTYKKFTVEISDNFEVISAKETSIGSVTPFFSGNLYTFSSHLDNNSLITSYEKREVLSSSYNNIYTEVKDINSTVSVMSQTDTMPTPQYADINITTSPSLTDIYSTYGTPFTFSNSNSQGTKIYVTYLTDTIKVYDVINDKDSNPFSTINSFRDVLVEGATTHGVRNHTRNKLLLLNKAELVADSSITSGTLVELDEDGSVITQNAGTWDENTTLLAIHPSSNVVSASGYNEDIAFILDEGVVKFGEYKRADEIYSYTLLNTEAKDELYNFISPDPKRIVELNSGFTYISLSGSKSLCDTDIQSTLTAVCDQGNTLESVFSSNIYIDSLYKYADEWLYWDSNSTVNPLYFMNKFSSVSPLDGLIVHSVAPTSVSVPFDFEDQSINDYSNMPVDKWILLSNHKEQTVAEIETSVAAKNKKILYIQLLRAGVWYVYAPTNDSEVSSSILRLSTVHAYEDFWIYLESI